jgi:ATP-dependent helicase HrpA
MILEARERQALSEVLIIASALSVQDVRDRPLEAQAQADQAHAKFDDDKSEFSGYLTLWHWLENSRGGKPHVPASVKHQLAAKQTQSQQKSAKPVVGANTKRCCAKTLSTCAACASGATRTPSCSRW